MPLSDPGDDDERLPDDVLGRPEEPRRVLGPAAEGVRTEGAVVLARLRHLLRG
jgi:hypothetical protein